jgi:TolB-like protein
MNDLITKLLVKIYKKIDDSIQDKGLFEIYQKIKSKNGKKVIIEKLSINEFILNGFEIALRSYTKNPESKVLALRLINWIKVIGHFLKMEFDLSLIKSEKKDPLLSFKQVRAIELLLRDIIYENHENQAELIKKLKTFFNSNVIDNWIKNADKTGVLSGTTFNELSTLFINKNMFEDYESIFKLSEEFKIEKSNIGTLRNLLDDIRVIRNSIAHNKEVSDVEINLLNEYYNEIIRNINSARADGRTKIEPDKYIKIDDQEIQKYINSIEDNFDELNKKIDENFESIKSDTEILKKGSKSSNKKLLYSLVGIFVIVIVTVLTLVLQKSDSDIIKNQNQKILDNTTDIKNDIETVKETISADSEIKNLSNSSDYTVVKELNERTKAENARRVAVIYFDNTSEEKNLDKLKKGLAGMLISDLSNVNMIDIVERDRIEEILKEQNLQSSEKVDQSSIVNLGKLLGAEIILTGAYFEMFGSFRIDARFIDVETGEILKSEGVDGQTSNFFKLQKQLTWKVIENLDVNLTDDEKNTIESQNELSYEDSLIYSSALEMIDNNDHENAIVVLKDLEKKYPNSRLIKNLIGKLNY